MFISLYCWGSSSLQFIVVLFEFSSLATKFHDTIRYTELLIVSLLAKNFVGRLLNSKFESIHWIL